MFSLGNGNKKAYLGDKSLDKAYLGSIEVFGNDFVSLWETKTANETITLPTPTDYRVDWGDGTVTTNTNSHVYATANQYTIKINGDITDFSFNNTGDKDKILDVSKFGGCFLIGGSFYGCLNLLAVDSKIKAFDNSLGNAFRGCSFFNSDLLGVDVSNVTVLSSIFRDSPLFNGDISNWQTGDVTTLLSAFQNASTFNSDISLWNVSKVENLGVCFSGAISFSGDLSLWNTENLMSCSNVFLGASLFNSNLTNWKMGKVTTTQGMFRQSGFNYDLVWETGEVLNMSTMFAETPFNSLLTFSDTSKVTSMNAMFWLCADFNQPLTLDTSNVDNMNTMFRDAVNFNQPLNFITSNVTNMFQMFRGAVSFNQDISSWSFVSVVRMNNFMNGKGVEYDVNYMDDLYIKLDQDLVFANMVNVNISFGSINYTTNGAAARASLVNKGFIITSGGQV